MSDAEFQPPTEQVPATAHDEARQHLVIGAIANGRTPLEELDARVKALAPGARVVTPNPAERATSDSDRHRTVSECLSSLLRRFR